MQTHVIKFMQCNLAELLRTEEPLIHRLKQILLSLFKGILQRLVKPDCIAEKGYFLQADYMKKDIEFHNDSLVVPKGTR